MSRLVQVWLLLSGLGFVLIGLNTLHDPVAAMAGVGLVPESLNAWNEVRANYGGMQIGIGLLLLAGLRSPALAPPAIWAAVAITGGLACGRLLSLWLDGRPGTLMLGLLALELTVALSGLMLLRFRR